MKKRGIIYLAVLILIILCITTYTLAGDSLSVSGTHNEKLKCIKDCFEGKCYYECVIQVIKTTKATSIISFKDFDIAELNEDSIFTMIANGEEVLSVSLGDDPNYRYGKNKAKIVIDECKEEEEEFCEYTGTTTVNLSWSKKQLIASIIRKRIKFTDYTDVPKCKRFKRCTEMEIKFGDITQTFNLNYYGKRSTKRIVKGENEYYVTNSSYSGKATPLSICYAPVDEEVCY